MNNYETIFLMKDDIAEEQREKVIDIIKNYLDRTGKIEHEENLGLKKLAYRIGEYEYAYYYIIQCNAQCCSISGLEKIYRNIDEIIKFITIKKD